MNEPAANACRTCGRWPSLFELEGNTIEADAPTAEEDEFAARSVEVEQLEPEVLDTSDAGDVPTDVELEDADDEESKPSKPRRRQLVRLIVPIAFVVYIAIKALANQS